MQDHEIVIAGFGGQGLLFSGKVLAYAGLIEGRELSWLPSYGPEMRGGTANCNDTNVSELTEEQATQMAMDNGLSGLANMILLGAVIEKTHCIDESSIPEALHKVIPARKADLFDANMKAIQTGKDAVL